MSGSLTLISGVVKKSDLNGHRIMHGGRLMTICDEVGYLAACKHSGSHGLTRAAHRLRFHLPMREADRYSVKSQVTMVTRTTMWVSCIISSNGKQMMDAMFVYVAIDKEMKPVVVPRLSAESDEEQRMLDDTATLYASVMESEKKKIKSPDSAAGANI